MASRDESLIVALGMVLTAGKKPGRRGGKIAAESNPIS